MKGKALVQALGIVNGERQNMYGAPEDSFAVIAQYWQTYLDTALVDGNGFCRKLESKDVAALMLLMKVARITTGSGGLDSYVDAAAYAALGADMAYAELVKVIDLETVLQAIKENA